jgi:hypothetical protein
MAKGALRTKGPGRPKGSLNKITKDLREMMLSSLGKVGGEDYLCKLAKENPQTYGALLGKCMPQAHTISGDPSNPLVSEIRVTLVEAKQP